MAAVSEDKFADVKQHFQSLFGLGEAHLNGQKERPLHQARRQAMERLQTLDFPTRRDEDWKYTSLTRVLQLPYQEPVALELDEEQIRPFLIAGLDANLLVFVNGFYSEELSQLRELAGRAELTTLDMAMADDRYRPLVERHLLGWPEQETNPFVALNTTFARHGIFLHLPANTALQRPIHLLHIGVPGAEPLLISPQALIVAGRSSEAVVLETYHELATGGAAPCFVNSATRCIVGANAVIRHIRVQWQGPESFLISNVAADQDRDSTYISFVADLGGRLVRNNLSAHLQAESTLTNLYGIFLGDGEQHVDNMTFIDHAHPHCQSNELYKNILTDRSRGVFTGKVMVRQDAQKTNAFQQNSTLVLSDKAQMDSKPQLEIFADDVRCSHGATIGQLEEDSVFYLRTRGLTAAEARSLLQHAFVREVIDFIPNEAVRETIDRWVIKKFAHQWTV